MGLFSKRLTPIRLFLASPGDMLSERVIVAEVVSRLNGQLSRRTGFTIELFQWPSNTVPGVGEEVQAVINRQIGACDVYLFLLWKRLGTPTKTFPSGTVEEFEYAYKRWTEKPETDVLVYFCERPFLPSRDEMPEFSRVLEFRDQLATRGVLSISFKHASDLQQRLSDDLTSILFKKKHRSKPRQKRPKTLLLYKLKTHRHFHGALTDLLNRGQVVGLIHLDFDNFTEVRDISPRKSEKILANLAQVIFEAVGHRGHLFRYAGDEFAILAPQLPEHSVLELAEEIRAAVESAGPYGELNITTSIGVGHSAKVKGFELFPRVYDALYVAKLTGRNRVVACPLTDEQVAILAQAHARTHS